MKRFLVVMLLLASCTLLAEPAEILHLTPEQQAANFKEFLRQLYVSGGIVRCTAEDLNNARGNCVRYAHQFFGLPIAEAAFSRDSGQKSEPIPISEQRPMPDLTKACDAKGKNNVPDCEPFKGVLALEGVWYVIPGTASQIVHHSESNVASKTEDRLSRRLQDLSQTFNRLKVGEFKDEVQF